jgi:hypothetical protein
MDTNDQNPTIRNGDSQGYFATFNDQVLPGFRAFIQNRDPKIIENAGVQAFVAVPYAAEIRANRPVLLFGANARVAIGHTVVGIGYEYDDQTNALTRLLVRDPASAQAQDWIGIPTGTNDLTAALARRAGVRYNDYGDIGISTFDSSLFDSIMFTFDAYTAPEPGSLALLGLGLAGLGLSRRRKAA